MSFILRSTRQVSFWGKRLWFWLPVLLWMGLIFLGSTDTLSGQKTSRILEPFLRQFFPEISRETIGKLQLVIRKTGHVVEYALLCWLLWRALRNSRTEKPTRWMWIDAVFAWIGALVFAISDEWHQDTTISRVATYRDVLFDLLGATLILIFIWIVGRWRKRW